MKKIVCMGICTLVVQGSFGTQREKNLAESSYWETTFRSWVEDPNPYYIKQYSRFSEYLSKSMALMDQLVAYFSNKKSEKENLNLQEGQEAPRSSAGAPVEKERTAIEWPPLEILLSDSKAQLALFERIKEVCAPVEDMLVK